MHSPALDVEWTPVLRVQAQMGGLLARLVPHARLVPAVRPEDMSQDPEVVHDYVSVSKRKEGMWQPTGMCTRGLERSSLPCVIGLQDPLNTQGKVCARTGNELLVAFRQLANKTKEISLPVYVAHGERSPEGEGARMEEEERETTAPPLSSGACRL